MGIPFFSRKTGKIEEEKVLGEFFVQMAYRPQSLWFTDKILSKRFLSELSGWVQNQKFSAGKIQDFIQQYDIDMNEFENKNFSSFNDFFIRQFKPDARKFDSDPLHFSAFAEARYLGVENIKSEQVFNVKDAEIDLLTLLQDSELAQTFVGGTLLVARLCPVDYHRFHFPVDGQIERFYRVPGAFHSVNPVAIRARPRLFLENERTVTIMQNEIFGKIAIIEVGAFGVGKIVQTHLMSGSAKRGAEKGYFLFGGSTVIVLLQKDKFQMAKDIDENSSKGLETWVPLGDSLGGAIGQH
jgi:phosphatidylserine decarboxylase